MLKQRASCDEDCTGVGACCFSAFPDSLRNLCDLGVRVVLLLRLQNGRKEEDVRGLLQTGSVPLSVLCYALLFPDDSLAVEWIPGNRVPS